MMMIVKVNYDEDLDDDEESLLSRLPADLEQLQKSITTAQGCLLLLVLREHLKVGIFNLAA